MGNADKGGAVRLGLQAAAMSPLGERHLYRHSQTMPEPIKFRCPNCETEYKVVLVEAPPTHTDPILCLSCGAPLQNREGKFALKYFRTTGSRRPNYRGSKLV